MTPSTAVTENEQTELTGATGSEQELTADALIEEVSIDGMCGVY
ncbi:MAG: mycofactocin precursor MftA [Nocardioides sp.]